MVRKEIGWEGVECVNVAGDKVGRAVVSKVMNRRVHYNAGNILAGEALYFLSGTLPQAFRSFTLMKFSVYLWTNMAATTT